MLIILSLILIFIENTLFLKGTVIFITLTFVSYLIGKRKNILYLLFVYVFFSLQTDRYFYNLLFILAYVLFNKILLTNLEYSRKTLIYISILQSSFYLIFNIKTFDLKYFLVNVVGILLFNYIYTKHLKNKESQWNSKEKRKNLH